MVNRALSYLKKDVKQNQSKADWSSGIKWVSKKSTRKEYAHRKPQAMRHHLRKLPYEHMFHWPIDRSNFWLSSRYGPRKNPGKYGGSKWGFHTGIDLAAPRGTQVMAAGTGTIVSATWTPGYGNTIVIEHDYKFRTRYAHLDKIAVHLGQKVNQGQYIGKVGSTGFVRKSRRGGDASHLHFEVYVYGKHDNPFYYLA